MTVEPWDCDKDHKKFFQLHDQGWRGFLCKSCDKQNQLTHIAPWFGFYLASEHMHDKNQYCYIVCPTCGGKCTLIPCPRNSAFRGVPAPGEILEREEEHD